MNKKILYMDRKIFLFRHSDRSNAVTGELQEGLSFIICSDCNQTKKNV